MNIMQKVTWNCMKKNKKRTIVTIVGVTICVAMICAVCIIISSLQDVTMRTAIEDKGSHEAKFVVEQKDAFTSLYKEDVFDKKLRISNVGNASLKDSGIEMDNTYRDTISIVSMDVEYSELAGVSLKEGDMPKNANEIVVSEELMKDEKFNYKVNDKITLALMTPSENLEASLSQEAIKQDFVITGIVKVNSEMKQSGSFFAFTPYQEVSDSSQVLYVSFKDKASMRDKTEKLAIKYNLDNDNYSLNEALAFSTGVSDNTLMDTTFKTCAILFIIIMIGGISLIYNAFSISLSERSRYLGMLSSIGATKRQRRSSIFFEAMIIGVIAIPLGIASSVLGLFITYSFINPYVHELFGASSIGLRVVVSWWMIGITTLFASIILLVSAWIPSRRASKISPIHAIRQNKDIKISRKRRTSSKIIRKLFGIEGELGLKNMKRHRPRYYATLSSLIICVFLFMSANYFSSTMKKSFHAVVGDNVSVDVQVNLNYTQDAKGNVVYQEASEKLIKDLQQANYASSSLYYFNIAFPFDDNAPFSSETTKLLNEFNEEKGNSHLSYNAFMDVRVLDDVSFMNYLKELDIEEDTLTSDIPSFILVNKGIIQSPLDNRYIELSWLQIKENDEVNYVKNENSKEKVRIGYITDKMPKIADDNRFYGSFEVPMITNFKNLAKLQEQNENEEVPLQPFFTMQFVAEDDLKLEQELSEILGRNGYNVEHGGMIENYSQEKRLSNQRTLFSNVLLYGFATLIALICIANIINTISTSIHLRKREFAMIRSIGITKKKFSYMIAFEILWYGIKAVVYGGILGLGAMYMIYRTLRNSFQYQFVVPIFSTLCMILVIFVILLLITRLTIRKMRKENVVETIRQESI